MGRTNFKTTKKDNMSFIDCDHNFILLYSTQFNKVTWHILCQLCNLRLLSFPSLLKDVCRDCMRPIGVWMEHMICFACYSSTFDSTHGAFGSLIQPFVWVCGQHSSMIPYSFKAPQAVGVSFASMMKSHNRLPMFLKICIGSNRLLICKLA